MKSLSPALASLANVFKIPVSMAPVRPSISRACHETLNRRTHQPGPVIAALQSAPFSTTSAMAARKGNGPVIDKRITLIRYFLHHPLTRAPSASLATSMQDACEELRTGAGDGGKLFRVSMNKKGIFTDMFPIEYARMQTESPPSDGWNYDWKKPGQK
ncbi:hypothetical protein PDIDSM_692 [Penicillium digitatum]|nr:hypothetical protein PDIDSM_692 [Penicillium digitatum]